MSRITITNKTLFPREDVVIRVAHVMAGGNVSHTAGRAHPCHLTKWADGMLIFCRSTRTGGLSFVVTEETP